MIAGDEPPSSTQETELLYVNGTTRICHSTANYPENVQDINSGSFLKNNLIVAFGGGTSACYSMSNDLKWTNFANFTTPMDAMASVIVNNGLWVTGNFDKFK